MPGQRKTDALRQRGNRTASLHIQSSGVARIVPPMPAGRWLKTTRTAWEHLFQSDIAEIIQPLDGVMLRHWITCIEERDRAMAIFREQRFVSGSRGQPRITPAWKLIQDLSVEIRQAESQLGIGGLNRFRLGLTIGQAANVMNTGYDAGADVETVEVEEPGVIDATAVSR